MAAATDDAADGLVDNQDVVGRGSVLEEFKEIGEVKSLIDNLKNVYNELIPQEMSCERFLFIIDKYQEQPHLIDPHLETLIGQVLRVTRNPESAPGLIQEAFKYLYFITKMRGYKVIVRQLPHEVSDVEHVLLMLSKQNPQDHETWETRYMLLLWLSIVCMIPFDMARLDSNTPVGDCIRKPVMQRILDCGMLYIVVNDKCQDAAAYLLSRFLTRPDVKKKKLPEVLDWILNLLQKTDASTRQGMSCLSGLLRTLALLFKQGKREDLLEYAPLVLQKLNACHLKLSDNSLLRKLHSKLVHRLGLIFVKAKVATWRYQRGSRSLADNLTESRRLVDGPPKQPKLDADIDEEEYDIPEEIEEVIEQLLGGLKDKDTVVRWSAAKGVGRVTSRLPRDLADEVVGSVLDLFSLQETDGAWHGGCLAIAELGRRGLLLPQRLAEVVPKVLRALAYDERRGNFSVGAHVRDAACYVCWSFARAYEPEDVTPHVNNIASALIIASIFDREVNVRRAAAAAFQENVGRQGTFPHGIDILTTVDYFAVGNKTHCFHELSMYVAQFSEYTLPLIDHLVQVKIHHWDSVMRELSSKALHKLTSQAPDYMANSVLPSLLPMSTGIDLHLRHGAILAAAEVTHALSKIMLKQGKHVVNVLSQETINGLKGIAQQLHNAKLFRGLGGELMRKAVSCLIEKLSLSRIPYHDDPIIDLWQEILDDCLHHLEPEVQSAAVTAIPAFFAEYYRRKDGTTIAEKQDAVLHKYKREVRSNVENSRMGYCQAMGVLPKFMICGKFQVILEALVNASQITKKDEKWAQARRDAIKAITSICRTSGLHPGSAVSDALCKDNLECVYQAYLAAMQDYTLDSRGDIGAQVREAAMAGLYNLTSLIVRVQPSLLSKIMCSKVICSIVQQACEKIDRTRCQAGEMFSKLLYHNPSIACIPHLEEIHKIFPEKDLSSINWAAPSDTFSRFTQLLQFPVYRYAILQGVTVSVGGLTESLVRHSSSSLFNYLRRINSQEKKLMEFANTVIQIFRDYQKVDRVSFPMLKMLDQMLARGCFELFSTEGHPVPNDIFELTKAEIGKCGDPQKIMASSDVFCGLLLFSGVIRNKALNQLLIQICHKYPRVRKTTANKLYESLITYDDIICDGGLEEVLQILSDTNWDNEPAELRPLRNRICALAGIKPPVLMVH